ncbi:MAG TPA: C4-dicarboxylate ABC transporter substrate-binding protein, partial [Gammaproteobacteria bacterium]|nr:C4-dicarboxylate ABC transporter substrate-binding protein [Gammaproteobacteria bacterium]
GEITVRITGPGAIPPFEQLQPTSAGLVDILFTHGAYHIGESGIGMALNAIESDPQALRKSGIWQAVDEHYRGLGLKLLALPSSARGYHMLLKEEIGVDCDLTGRKIRGSPAYLGLIQSLGATPVVLPAGEVYAALEKHVVDGTAWPAAGSLPFRWYEVTAYYLRPTFGATTHQLFINRRRFEDLSSAKQQLLLKEGEILERDVQKRFHELVTIEEDAFKKFGLKSTRLCGEPLARLARYWSQGSWSMAMARSPLMTERLYKMAVSAGMTK